MLGQLAARLRARQGDLGVGGGGVVLGEDGEAVLVDDNCTVSLFFAPGDDRTHTDGRTDNVTQGDLRSGQAKHLAGMNIGYFVSDLANKSTSRIYVKHVKYKHQNKFHQCECTHRSVMGT